MMDRNMPSGPPVGMSFYEPTNMRDITTDQNSNEIYSPEMKRLLSEMQSLSFAEAGSSGANIGEAARNRAPMRPFRTRRNSNRRPFTAQYPLQPQFVPLDFGVPPPNYQEPPPYYFDSAPQMMQAFGQGAGVQSSHEPAVPTASEMENEFLATASNTPRNPASTGAIPRRLQTQVTTPVQVRQAIRNRRRRPLNMRNQTRRALNLPMGNAPIRAPPMRRPGILQLHHFLPASFTMSSSTASSSAVSWKRNSKPAKKTSNASFQSNAEPSVSATPVQSQAASSVHPDVSDVQPSTSNLSPNAKEFYPQGYVSEPHEDDPKLEMTNPVVSSTDQPARSDTDEITSSDTVAEHDSETARSVVVVPNEDQVLLQQFPEICHMEMVDIIQICQHELCSNPGSFSRLMRDFETLFKKWLKCNETTEILAICLFDVTIQTPSFLYLSAKMCLHLSNILPQNVFQKKLIQRVQLYYSEVIHLLDKEDCSQVYSFVLFLAELYIQLEQRKKNKTRDFGIPLIGTLEQLLKNPKQNHINCFVKVMKLAGMYLDDDMTMQMSSIMDDAEQSLPELGEIIDTSGLLALIELRHNNWGRVEENDTSESSAFEDSETTEDTQNSTDPPTDAVYYGPDGQIMTEEERRFLEQESDKDDVDSMDEEMQEAFEQFLLTLPEPR